LGLITPRVNANLAWGRGAKSAKRCDVGYCVVACACPPSSISNLFIYYLFTKLFKFKFH
jgi:hypothetical protein